MKHLFRKSHGFTLVELMVVMTIMSIMAAIVVPAVTGTTTVGRGTTMTADIKTVQDAVERFVGDHPQGTNGGWPTSSGILPLAADVDVPLHWGATFVSKDDGVTVKVFAAGANLSGPTPNLATYDPSTGSYLRTAIPHAGAFRTTNKTTGTVTDATLSIPVISVGTSAKNITVSSIPVSTPPGWTKLDATTPLTYPVWRIDSTGKVLLNLAKSEY